MTNTYFTIKRKRSYWEEGGAVVSASSWASASCPFSVAKCSGVLPSLSTAEGSAHASSRC